MGFWLWSHLVVVPEEELPEEELPAGDDLQSLWVSRGVEPAVVECPSHELRLHWKGGLWRVAGRCRDMEDLREQISFALLSIWRSRPDHR
eukprot:4930607-Lingulodinium_polyedra.AAC.1